MAEGLVLTEQRRLNRRELIYYLKIVDKKSGLELGRMADIHAEGMLVLGDKPLAIGKVYEIYLELPKVWAAANGQEKLELTIEAAWVRPGPKNSTYQESGVRFINIDQNGKDVINRLIDLLAMPTK